MTGFSRRKFLSTSSGAIAAFTLTPQTLSAAEVGGRSGADFLPEPAANDYLRSLATHALDVARGAGASYADIRLAQDQIVRVALLNGLPQTSISSKFAYGIRVIVSGAMAFQYGNLPTVDSIASIARRAVTQARGFSKFTKERAELAPGIATSGEWSSAYDIDPFQVPILEQADLMGALNSAIGGRMEGVGSGASSFNWQRETRVFASTEGSVNIQTFMRGRAGFSAIGDWMGIVGLSLPSYIPSMAGYESVMRNSFQEDLNTLGDEALRYAKLPARPLDVGRYPIVMDGSSVARVMTTTIGPALQLDRVLGYETNASGSSFLGPPEEVLGAQLMSPLMTMTVERPLDDITGAKWDDDGVMPEQFKAIDGGRVVDYCTDRLTAPSLREYYKERGAPLKSHGCAIASRADSIVTVGTGHMTMSHSDKQVTIQDLCKDISKGVLLLNAMEVSTDQQLSSGNIYSGVFLEVKNGRISNRIRGAALQFRTTGLWKGLEGIGGASTLRSVSAELYKGQPWQAADHHGRAPAARFKEIDMIQIGGR